ncbi:MAG TPA: hypothetical protein VE944_19300 [Nostoc sp.]|nr:hypothetical protein [Nostoc sp.]HYX16469.1 hypothetical protein [Nostoc sp.]
MSKTKVNSDGSFSTDDNGREREATPQEIDTTLREWEGDNSGKKGKRK